MEWNRSNVENSAEPFINVVVFLQPCAVMEVDMDVNIARYRYPCDQQYGDIW